MANDLKLVEAFPQVATHWNRLQVRSLEEFRRSPLIGTWQVTVIQRELDKALRPASRNEAAEVAQLLLGSYPKHLIDEPEIYSRAMVELLRDYPVSVGLQAVDQVTRDCKFIPTRAEVFSACEEAIGKLRFAKFIADRTEEERARRAQEDDRRKEVEIARRAFLLKHNGKSPLEVLAEMGLTAKGMDNGEGQKSTSDQGQDLGGAAGSTDEHAEPK